MEDVIYGKNAVTEALEAGTREINKIWIANNIHTDMFFNTLDYDKFNL